MEQAVTTVMQMYRTAVRVSDGSGILLWSLRNKRYSEQRDGVETQQV